MRLILPIGLLALAALALCLTPADALILGLDHGHFAQAALAGALVLWLLLGGPWRLGPANIGRALSGALTWAVLMVALTGLYAYRFEFSEFADRVLAELNAAEPVVGQGGEVIISQRLGGEFVVAGKVNNTSASFLFDTGASTVVIRAQDAKKMGIETAALDYDVRVTTANGAAMAAETRLDQLSVGPIVVRNVRALIARPGALSENLLGMSFLERLQSYSVERGRLVLKAR
ncbi:TIGR02281 family clan AA aspartic protease [Methylocapsa sp. S129]|uniref:retropepsin-like aspartic protease family protein n=1 Tax=Methylocapsa sp. S129 TaxID=1641869 RepID=UPI00131BA2C5|nr:TIGR02281 family clan AA aspartic protease [Methylocapsa sp. S129]